MTDAANHETTQNSAPAHRRTVAVRHRLGLHARPAADFVRLANTFGSEIRVRKGRRTVNGKSIMGLLTLAAAVHSRITIEAAGTDAADAVKVLGDFLLAGDQAPLVPQ